MTVQITIVGLGQIGASIGLALAERGDLIRRVGHDREYTLARQALKMGAIDKVEINLPSAVREADLVMLSLPVDQIEDTLKIIAEDLKEGAVVMDTGPAKGAVEKWVAQLLPAGRFYVGLTPVLNPAYLHTADSGLEAARADLFQNGLLAIVCPPQTDAGALKLASDLARLLGVAPLFADPLEIDGLVAATHLLPQFMAAALVNATANQPGWREGQKLTGRAYAEASGPIAHLDGPPALVASALYNRENVTRVLDNAIQSLYALRQDIDAGDTAALEKQLTLAYQERDAWWRARQSGEAAEPLPTVQMPERQSMFGRLFSFGFKDKPERGPAPTDPKTKR